MDPWDAPNHAVDQMLSAVRSNPNRSRARGVVEALFVASPLMVAESAMERWEA